MYFTLIQRRISSFAARQWASSASVRRELPFDDPREPMTATLPDYDPLALPYYEIFLPSVENSHASTSSPHAQQTQAPAKTGRRFFSSALQLGLAESATALQSNEVKTSPAELLHALHDEAQVAIATAASIADAANDRGFTPACSSGAVSSRMRARQLRSLKERSDNPASAEC